MLGEAEMPGIQIQDIYAWSTQSWIYDRLALYPGTWVISKKWLM